MAEEGLVAQCVRKRMRCSSYGGEATEALPNILAREFRASAPNTRRVADITEMGAADGKRQHPLLFRFCRVENKRVC